MKRSILIQAVSLACAAALWGCPAEPAKPAETQAAPTEAAAPEEPAAAEPETAEAAETAAPEVPVPEDFVDEVAASITAENYEAELEALAAEIDTP